MKREKTTQYWLLRGSQKSALSRSLIRPMTPIEILYTARQHAPRIQLRDVSNILKQAEKRNLIKCITPEEITGRVYFWKSEQVRRIAARILRVRIRPVTRGISWKAYSFVARGSVRKILLHHMARFTPKRATAGNIRKKLCEKHAIGLNAVRRALRELVIHQLVEVTVSHDGTNLYKVTKKGLILAQQFC